VVLFTTISVIKLRRIRLAGQAASEPQSLKEVRTWKN